MNEYYWPHMMAKEASIPQAGRCLPNARMTVGKVAEILETKLTVL